MKFMPKKKVEEKKEEQKEVTSPPPEKPSTETPTQPTPQSPPPERPSTETPTQPTPQSPPPQRPSTETPTQPSPQSPPPKKPVQNKPPTQVPQDIVQKPVQQRPQPRPETKPPTQTIKKVGQEEPTAPPAKQSTQQEMKTNVDTDIIKKIIKALASSSENSINPVINFEKNQVSYPILSKIGEDELNTDLLEKLSSKTAGVLDKEVYERMVVERMVVCPQHPEDLSVSIRLYCPECSSIHVERLQLIEHKICGYIAVMEEFGVTAVTDVTTCPHCKRQIKDASKEIRTPGRWNKCHECGEKFDNVIIKLFCRRYNHDFEIMEAGTFPISYYKLRRQADESVDVITLVPALKKIFSSRGFVVEEFASVKGKSGVAHQTSLYAHDNQNKTIAVFIKSSKNPIEDSEVNAIIVNVLDISPSRTILIAMPSVSERAKTMAASHGVSVVTGKEPNQITATIEQMLSRGLAVQANSG